MSAAGPHRVAVLTPPGAGAIALIRVVGPDPISLVNTIFRPKTTQPLSQDRPDRLRFGQVVDGEETLDEVVAVAHAINGMAAVDITPHGGTRVVERILEALQRRGAEVCSPRDASAWTWAATCGIEHEILDAMMHVKTERAFRFLAYQRNHLSSAIVRIAQEIGSNPTDAAAGLFGLLEGIRAARALVEGVTVALVGPPNSGKSTLFNRLLGREAVVVSDIPGTTRDWIAEPIELLGLPVTLVDTAGQHEAGSPLEELAIEAGRRMAERADLRVLVLDAGRDHAAPHTPALNGPDFTVWNKSDLNPGASIESGAVAVSARTGAGLDQLAERILAAFDLEAKCDPRPSLFTEAQYAWANDILAELKINPERAAAALRRRTRRIDS